MLVVVYLLSLEENEDRSSLRHSNYLSLDL